MRFSFSEIKKLCGRPVSVFAKSKISRWGGGVDVRLWTAGFVASTAHATARLKASGMEIIGMVPELRKQWSFGSSLNRYVNIPFEG
jgi:hypothetical protein